VDAITGLAARYCVRQDARGFVELWGLFVALAAAAVAISISLRRGIGNRLRQRTAFFALGALACLILVTCAVAWAILRWCYESAPALLGMAPNASGTFLNTEICFSLHALEMMDGWILIAASCIVAVVLLALGIFQLESRVRRALWFAGAAVALIFASASAGLVLFGASWCQSQRLF
jgi:hypothetical protein